ncbi:acyl-CoA dehydrogenase family protein [Advenella sp. RU8]|uniref:acyl-CoA dehydrogenase family protein n=1 Tax=Advenella sp. RU8 TaxID=3399575 RepID=UPI003AAEFAE4
MQHDPVSDNLVPDLQNYNVFDCDPALKEALKALGASWAMDDCHEYGGQMGSAAVLQHAVNANRHPPVYKTINDAGGQAAGVSFHDSWHVLLRSLFEQGVHSDAWQSNAHVRRAALFYLHAQAEAGSLCPVTMTFAAIPALKRESWFEDLIPHLFSREYDSSDQPLEGKKGMMIGMGMTEKQGGSDVRVNTTIAQPAGQYKQTNTYCLNGHKWFFSSPLADAHLVLAQLNGELSCFFVPRWCPDGSLNGVKIQRLKDKMGNRSNASAEVLLQNAWALPVGEPGRGIQAIIKMVTQTRLDCVLGSTGLLRQAVVQAVHHARHRRVFGKLLVDQPLMQMVLCDLVLESEAAMWLSMVLAHAVENRHSSLSRAYARIVTPAAKFWVCKRAVETVAECMEVWGGNGYIEDGPMPRLLREAPVNSIWEGSGNVMCLDVLRALRNEPELGEVLLGNLSTEAGMHSLLSQAVNSLKMRLRNNASELEYSARQVAQELVLLVQATLMCHYAPSNVAEAFIQSRFSHGGRIVGSYVYPDPQKILQRALVF